MRKFIFTALLLAVAGCGGGGDKKVQQTGMSAAECQTADWRTVGYEEGATGHGTDGIAGHRRDCARYGISPDLDGYLAGHAKGIAVYCHPQNGFNLGRNGHQYSGGCPFAMEGAFMTAMADGKGLYDRQTAVNNIQQQLTYAAQRIQEIDYALADKVTDVPGLLLNPLRSVSAGLEVKNLVKERKQLKASVPQLEHDLDAAVADYEGYRDSLMGRYA